MPKEAILNRGHFVKLRIADKVRALRWGAGTTGQTDQHGEKNELHEVPESKA